MTLDCPGHSSWPQGTCGLPLDQIAPEWHQLHVTVVLFLTACMWLDFKVLTVVCLQGLRVAHGLPSIQN